MPERIEPAAASFHRPMIGLIGGIGSGKSMVARMFADLGACVIVGDQLGHEALRRPEVKAQAIARWGRSVLDESGEVARPKLAEIVFAQVEERRALERMVHPYIERSICREVERARSDPQVPLIVLDAAILIETGWGRLCDAVIFVDAPREQRLARLARSRGWSAKEVEAREKAQLSLEEKRNRADAIIDNSGTQDQTRIQVEEVFHRWQQTPPSNLIEYQGGTSVSG